MTKKLLAESYRSLKKCSIYLWRRNDGRGRLFLSTGRSGLRSLFPLRGWRVWEEMWSMFILKEIESICAAVATFPPSELFMSVLQNKDVSPALWMRPASNIKVSVMKFPVKCLMDDIVCRAGHSSPILAMNEVSRVQKPRYHVCVALHLFDALRYE